MLCVKQLVESGCITTVPSKYVSGRSLDNSESRFTDQEEVIPIIDFSQLTSGNAEQRSKVIEDLGNACREWGFFMVRTTYSIIYIAVRTCVCSIFVLMVIYNKFYR